MRGKSRRTFSLRGLALSLILGMVVSLFVMPVTGADATEPEPGVSEQGAELRWGIREEWRNYIGLGPGHPGPGATGTIEATGEPATVDAQYITTWKDGEGTVDVDAGTGEIQYRGEMTLTGHYAEYYPNGWGMRQVYKDPQIRLTGSNTAVLSFEMAQVSILPTWPALPSEGLEGPRYDLVELEFDGQALKNNRYVTTSSAKLTETGARIWANYGAYVPGVEMDAVTFSIGAAEIAEQAETKSSLSVDRATVTKGEKVRLEASVDPAVSGAFEFFRNGESFASVVAAEGKATYEVDTAGFDAGQHSFYVQFTPEDLSAYASSHTRNAPTTLGVVEPADVTATEGQLEWGVRESFRGYVIGHIASGRITPSRGATQQQNNGVFVFPQAKNGKNWNGKTGSVQYAGQVNFYGHDGVMNVTLANPLIEVKSDTHAVMKVPFGPKNELIVLAEIDLGAGQRQKLDGDAVRFSQAKVKLAKTGEQFFSDPTGQGGDAPFYRAGTELDRISFTIGSASEWEIAAPPVVKPQKPKAPNTPAPKPAPPAQAIAAAGNLKWGVSDYFVMYTTGKSGTSSCRTAGGHCAGGSIATSGVGQGWLFPQAAGGSWNKETQTGTVQFSGVVSFRGYGTTMFQVVNPRITVTSPTSATLYTGYSGRYGPSSVPLNLGAAQKTVGASGEVTWSNVPVGGGLIGISASQTIGFDPLTFTVGVPSQTTFAPSQQGSETKKYEAADTPPTTSGLNVLTPADKITEGGRIAVEASGFDAGDSGVLVVLYERGGNSGPMVLDDDVTADSSGKVSWSGTLPKNQKGDHVITVQGSTNAGAEIKILEKREKRAAVKATTATLSGSAAETEEAYDAAGLPLPAGMALWEWWAAAGGLAAIAACTTILAVRQRRDLAASSWTLEKEENA